MFALIGTKAGRDGFYFIYIRNRPFTKVDATFQSHLLTTLIAQHMDSPPIMEIMFRIVSIIQHKVWRNIKIENGEIMFRIVIIWIKKNAINMNMISHMSCVGPTHISRMRG